MGLSSYCNGDPFPELGDRPADIFFNNFLRWISLSWVVCNLLSRKANIIYGGNHSARMRRNRVLLAICGLLFLPL